MEWIGLRSAVCWLVAFLVWTTLQSLSVSGRRQSMQSEADDLQVLLPLLPLQLSLQRKYSRHGRR